MERLIALIYLFIFRDITCWCVDMSFIPKLNTRSLIFIYTSRHIIFGLLYRHKRYTKTGLIFYLLRQVVMTTLISSHVKDKNYFFVTEIIVVFYHYLYSNPFIHLALDRVKSVRGTYRSERDR